MLHAVMSWPTAWYTYLLASREFPACFGSQMVITVRFKSRGLLCLVDWQTLTDVSKCRQGQTAQKAVDWLTMKNAVDNKRQ